MRSGVVSKPSFMKSALFVVGGWEGHEPMLSAETFVDCLKLEGYRTEIVDTLEIYCDAERLRRFDLIVPVWTMGTITNEQEKGLLDAIRRGIGIAGWHGCMADSFRNNTEYQFMVGGQWVDYRRYSGLRHAIGAILHARRSVERGARDDHL